MFDNCQCLIIYTVESLDGVNTINSEMCKEVIAVKFQVLSQKMLEGEPD
jgi:hypothetical protein